MENILRVLLQRDPARDCQDNDIHRHGYEILWPDGSPLSVGFDAFCKQGQRLLGLTRHLVGCPNQLVDMICVPLSGPEDDLTRLPGHRVRRFYLHRTGRQARLHFMDGTPTAIILDLDRDESRVLAWVGLHTLSDGECGWFDLAARNASPPSSPTPPPGSTPL